MLHGARWNTGRKKSPKIRHLCTISQHCRAISSQLRYISTIQKNLLSSNMSPTRPQNMANFGLQAAEIGSLVWGTPSNFNGFRVLPALLHGTQVVGVSQILRRWTEGATYIRQDGHHVWYWPTFYIIIITSVAGFSRYCFDRRLSCSSVSLFVNITHKLWVEFH